MKDKDKQREANRRYYFRNRDKIMAKKRTNESQSYENTRDRSLQRNYGISLDEYNVLLKTQGGLCAVCKGTNKVTSERKRKVLCVDHCHTTGKVRGLLCDTCNRAIGMLKDSEELLQRALEYLRG